MVAGLCRFVFSSFRGEKTPHQKTKRRKKTHAKKRKDEITPCKKTKPATRKAEILARKDEKKPCEETSFETLIVSSFRVASFRLFARRYFAAKRRKDAMRKDEKNEITPSLILHASTSPSPTRFILDTPTSASR